MKQKSKPLLFTLLFFLSINVQAQNKVEGIIRNDNGYIFDKHPILEKDTNVYTLSDSLGRFVINTTKDTSILIFSYGGYLTKRIQITKDTFLNVLLENSYNKSKWLSTGIGHDGINTTFGLQISNGLDEHPLIHFEDIDDSWLYKISTQTNFKNNYSIELKIAYDYLFRQFYLPTIEYKVAKFSVRDLNYETINFSLVRWLRNIGILTKLGHQKLNGKNNIGGNIGLLNSHREPNLSYGFAIGYWKDYPTYDIFFQSFLLKKKFSLGIHFERLDNFNFLNFQLNYVFNKVSTNLVDSGFTHF